jgi:hypothetical protein
MAGELGPLAPHPGFELVDQGSRMLTPIGEPVAGRITVDLALADEDRVDPADRLQCHGRWWAPASPAEVGELEEAPPGVSPAERFGDWAASSRRRIEPAKATVGIGLQDPSIADQVLLGVVAAAITRVVEENSRRALAKGAIVADIGP